MHTVILLNVIGTRELLTESRCYGVRENVGRANADAQPDQRHVQAIDNDGEAHPAVHSEQLFLQLVDHPARGPLTRRHEEAEGENFGGHEAEQPARTETGDRGLVERNAERNLHHELHRETHDEGHSAEQQQKASETSSVSFHLLRGVSEHLQGVRVLKMLISSAVGRKEHDRK